MSLTPNPVLIAPLKALTRSLLFASGIDQVLVDFLARSAIGTMTVLITFLFVDIGVPRCRRSQSSAHAANAVTKVPALPNRTRVKA